MVKRLSLWTFTPNLSANPDGTYAKNSSWTSLFKSKVGSRLGVVRQMFQSAGFEHRSVHALPWVSYFVPFAREPD